MIDHRWNTSHQPYSTAAWLDNHHAIKSRLRSELIAKLSINSGDCVLDLGCGPGNWSILCADRVGVRGRVTGVDADETVLDAARRRREGHCLAAVIDFAHARLEDIELAVASHDVVLLFNVLSYIREPQALIAKAIATLRPGGRLFIKDTDLQSDFYWPVPFDVHSSIMRAIVSGTTDGLDGYNPFFARQVPGLLRRFPGLRVSTFSQSFSFFAPLAREEREYVRANAALVSELAVKAGALEDVDAWYSLFDDGREGSILDGADFTYAMNEFVFQAVVT
ncbi:MAG: methyltransferase domain-containing protein [Phycisphaerales bacterium]|nr:methyltransferase domain-containing protein [Hyphomonadaceae bacterium]